MTITELYNQLCDKDFQNHQTGNLFFPAYSDNKPISLVLDLSPQVPIMKLTNDFSIGESIDFKNIFSSYL